MLNGQTFSSRTGKTSGLPKFELRVRERVSDFCLFGF
jgi:hypothetical protein